MVQKSNGKGILAKGCIKTSTCDNGLCKALNQTGLYSTCRGVCCTGDLCDGLSLNSTPTNTPVPKPTVTTGKQRFPQGNPGEVNNNFPREPGEVNNDFPREPG